MCLVKHDHECFHEIFKWLSQEKITTGACDSEEDDDDCSFFRPRQSKVTGTGSWLHPAANYPCSLVTSSWVCCAIFDMRPVILSWPQWSVLSPRPRGFTSHRLNINKLHLTVSGHPQNHGLFLKWLVIGISEACVFGTTFKGVRDFGKLKHHMTMLKIIGCS